MNARRRRVLPSLVVILYVFSIGGVFSAWGQEMWAIVTPLDDEQFDNAEIIEGTGTGPANGGYTFRFTHNGALEGQANGTTDAWENWVTNLDPKVHRPTEVWTLGEGTIELIVDNVAEDWREIEIVNN